MSGIPIKRALRMWCEMAFVPGALFGLNEKIAFLSSYFVELFSKEHVLAMQSWALDWEIIDEDQKVFGKMPETIHSWIRKTWNWRRDKVHPSIHEILKGQFFNTSKRICFFFAEFSYQEKKWVKMLSWACAFFESPWKSNVFNLPSLKGNDSSTNSFNCFIFEWSLAWRIFLSAEKYFFLL